MRIGVVSHLFPTGQRPMFGVFVKDELDRLSEHAEIRLFAPYPNQRWFTRDRDNSSLKYQALRPFVLAFPRFILQRRYPDSMARSLGKAVRRGFFDGCDLIHVHNAFPDAGAVVRVFSGRLPIVVTVHGSDVNLFAMKESLRPDIVRSLNAADRIIAVSSALAGTLGDIGVTTPIHVIPNGIDTNAFKPGDRTAACGRIGLDPARPRILFAGNFAPVKGVAYLLRAMPAILARYPDSELVLVGARPGTNDKTIYDDEISRAGITNSVRVCDAVPHDALPGWMNAADVFVLPSLHEGFGIVAAEALACGIPVVATRSGGPEDIVKAGQGLLVPPKDTGALSDAILSVLDRTNINPPTAIAEDAGSRFSFEKVTSAIIDVYKDVLTQRQMVT